MAVQSSVAFSSVISGVLPVQKYLVMPLNFLRSQRATCRRSNVRNSAADRPLKICAVGAGVGELEAI